MRALVTGASGFVGGYLVPRLAAEGAEVLGIDSDIPGARARSGSIEIGGRTLPPALPARGAELRMCDLLDEDDLDETVREWSPDVVFHLAAQSSAALSFERPSQTMRINVIGTINLLEAVRKAGGARVLVTGSCEEYGRRDPGEMPLSEDAPIEPVSPYAASKAAQGLIAMQYHRAFGIEIVSTRSFSHTGPGQTVRFVLPAVARQCAEIKAGLREPVLRAGILEVKRDFMDVRDVVEAYVLLAENGRPGITYNVSSGRGLELKDAVERLIGMTGREVSVERDPDLVRPVDVPVLIGDNTRLKDECGWSAAIGTGRMLEDLFSWWEATVAAGHAG
jgi:GDP-4-dehydro-6-deoxy-D-mannose reductase